MHPIFKRKTRLEKLQEKHTSLMRKSFSTSLNDRERSNEVKKLANEVFKEIEYLNLKLAHK
ncbi:Lacal_2735 family protein [Patiriisocius sp. Uisw_017]|jgi:hypothetical protein|uniref:Lacal_2735 family protein n=1 Tax=Patiriisocius sp. Uisw_017 TaxID=3230968 RepID=UPI0039ECF52B